MGILDDLKSQAEQKNKPAGEQLSAADAEEFYRAHIKQRMLMANDFLTQLVNQLNEIKLVIKAEYPFKPEGKTVTLLQQGYKAYSDHITDPRQITLGFTCILANPSTYDVRGRAPALAQGELLERYQFKYEKLEARDQNRMVIGARFKLQGPLQVRCVLQFDEAKQIIKLLLTNIVGPGTSQYNLKPEQLDEAFLDRLGKYLLRKEANLFQEEISDYAKALLRTKLQQEQQQREAELRAVEEQRKAEEAVRKQNSTTGQLKKAVSQSVAENKEKLKKVMEEQVREKGEKLKNMFNKLKNRAGSETVPEQAPVPPAVNPRQVARPTGNPSAQGLPPVNRQAGQTASPGQNATRPKPPIAHKNPTPPKVFVSSASNPFLKPEDFEPVPKVGEEQTQDSADTNNPSAQPSGQTATPAAAQARSTAAASAPVAKTANPFLQIRAGAARAETQRPTAQSPAQTATPATAKTPNPAMSPAAAQARPAAESNTSLVKSANPFLQTKAAAVQAGTQQPPSQSPALSATPATYAPTTLPAAEAKPVAAPNAPVAKTTSPSSQSKRPAEADEPKLSLEPIAPGSEASTPAAPAESGLSLEPIARGSEASTPAASAESGLSLEPAASDVEVSSPAAPAESALSPEPTALDTEAFSPATPAESALSLEPAASDAEVSSPATPAESALSPEPTALDTETSSLKTKTVESQAEPSSEPSALSLEDQLERDLARIMENEQQQPSLETDTTDDPSSTSGELDLDLSSPDALEIHFEDTDKDPDQDNSEPRK